MESVWQEISEEFLEIEIQHFDADDDTETHQKFNIKDLPTTIFLNGGGNEVLRFEGIKNKDEIKEMIRGYGG